ncbi:MAG TPA: glycyl radical protein [Firmicutes bacterium]|nr:glycyl radical protein [Bacillota bacterium]
MPTGKNGGVQVSENNNRRVGDIGGGDSGGRIATLTGERLARVRRLRDSTLASHPRVCPERAVLWTEVHRRTENLPMVMRRALALKRVLEEMSIYILDGELIVGNQASTPRAAPIFPEYAVEWLKNELDELADRPADPFLVSEDAKRQLKEVISYWEGRTHEDRVRALLPDEIIRAQEIKIFHAEGNIINGDGHLILDFEKVLSNGLYGIISEAEDVIKRLDLSDAEDLRKLPFLEGVKIVCEAAITFASRYAREARRLAAQERDLARRRELERIAEICARVPAYPARTFQEALQTVWFLQVIAQIESSGHGYSLGRLDQYMFPYYQNDISAGRLTPDGALELLECFWIKLFSVNKIRSWSHTRFGAGYPLYENLTLGGQTPDGRDATNDLSYLCLDAAEDIRLTQPNLSVRYHRSCTDKFLLRCCEVIRKGFGMPALMNDEIIIPALLSRGVKLEDAMNWATIGCVEIGVPGKWGYRATGMGYFNLLKSLELTLNGGRDPKTGIELYPTRIAFEACSSFDELWSEWKRQISYYIRLHAQLDSIIDLSLEDLTPDVFASALTQDCIRRGKTIKEGGAVYDIVSPIIVGTANLANSFAAIKKLVFEDHSIEPEALLEALRNDFSGHEGERIRRLLINRAPKYGNDDDYVDTIAADIQKAYIEELSRYKNTRYGRGPIGGVYSPSSSTISANVPMGLVVGATPDGRRSGEPVAEGVSPFRGTDRKGPTAVFKSVSKLPNIYFAVGGQLLNQKITPGSLNTREGLKKLADMIRAYFDLKGWHVQFNVIDADTLRDAQKNPEQYTDLVVRVAGYSALFVALDPATQDDIIARTEHSI